MFVRERYSGSIFTAWIFSFHMGNWKATKPTEPPLDVVTPNFKTYTTTHCFYPMFTCFYPMFTPCLPRFHPCFYPCFCSFKPRHPSNWGAHVHSTNLSALPLEAEDDCSRQQSCGVAAEPHTPGHPLPKATDAAEPSQTTVRGDVFLSIKGFLEPQIGKFAPENWLKNGTPKVMEVSKMLDFPFVLFRFCVSFQGVAGLLIYQLPPNESKTTYALGCPPAQQQSPPGL